MAWAFPQHTPQEVNAAGRSLGKMEFPVSTDEGFAALAVINNWRSSHAYPLNTFQITLRTRARRIEHDVIIAQREKRLDSIHRKLVTKSTMRMTQMQDIAGCRAARVGRVETRRFYRVTPPLDRSAIAGLDPPYSLLGSSRLASTPRAPSEARVGRVETRRSSRVHILQPHDRFATAGLDPPYSQFISFASAVPAQSSGYTPAFTNRWKLECGQSMTRVT